MDSIFNFPSKVEYITSFSIVKRKNKEQPDGNITVHTFFSEKSNRYQWKIRRDPLLADYIINDTIDLKPHTWYELSTERYNSIVYFYWNGKKGDYILKEKPRPGAW